MAFDHGQGAAFEEAAALAGVAGGTDLVYFDEQCVSVAIQEIGRASCRERV